MTIVSLFVSRKHCLMHFGDDGSWYIRDCNTLNGTFINDDRIAPNVDYKLKIGDKIGLGISISCLNTSEYPNPDYYVYKLINSTEQRDILGYDVNTLCWDLENL